MSKQLTVASTFSIFALSALALFAQGSASPSDLVMRPDMMMAGAATIAAAPAYSAQLALTPNNQIS